MEYSRKECGEGFGSGWWVQTETIYGALEVQGTLLIYMYDRFFKKNMMFLILMNDSKL